MLQSENGLTVVAAIIWQERRYLAVQRPPGVRFAGLWEFPGGKVEPGEDLEQALCRELREELAIEVRACSFWQELPYRYPNLLVRLNFFHVHGFGGEPRPMEGQVLRWLHPAAGHTLPFLEADRGVVAELAAQFGGERGYSPAPKSSS